MTNATNSSMTEDIPFSHIASTNTFNTFNTGTSDDISPWSTSRHGAATSVISCTSLHGSLMRSFQNRDPMKTYHMVSILGEGSMGSVAMVRKRDSTSIGNLRTRELDQQQPTTNTMNGESKKQVESKNKSMDQQLQKQDKGGGCCFSLFSWIQPRRQPSQKDSFVTISTLSDEKLLQTLKDNLASTSPTAAATVDFCSETTAVDGLPPRQNSSRSSSQQQKKEICYALKSIHLDRCTNTELQLELKNEVSILKSLDHPNIVRAIETFDYRRRLYIVLELCSGGDLYSRDPYNEKEALRIVSCVLDAVSYLHSKGIIHRDLKFENIMFTTKKKHAEIKIIDFGLSKKFAKNEFLKDAVGTVYTMAPELVSGNYNYKADVWSVGVLAFMLLSSSIPFYGKSRNQVIKKILRGRFHFSSRRWKNASEDAVSFVRTLLKSNPSERPTAVEAMKLPWIVNRLRQEESTLNADVETMDSIQANIQAFTKYSTLKKLALMVVAYRSTAEELGFLRRMFTRYDSQHQGEITEEQFANAISIYGYQSDEIHELFRGIDIDGTGTIHYIEFLAATLETLGPIEEDRLAEAFHCLDCDDSGYITIAHLRDFLGEEVPVQSLEKIIDEADIDHDHRISYKDFVQMWNEGCTEELKVAKQNVVHRRMISREPSFMSSISSDDLESSGDLMISNMRGELLSHDELLLHAEVQEIRCSMENNKQQDESDDGVWI